MVPKAERLLMILLVFSVLVTLCVVVGVNRYQEQIRTIIKARHLTQMSILGERLHQYFLTIDFALTIAASDPRFQEMQPNAAVQNLCEKMWNDCQVSAVILTPAGDGASHLVFPEGNRPVNFAPIPETLLKNHGRMFVEHPRLDAWLEGLPVDATDHQGLPPGLLYTVPVRDGEALRGTLTVVIPNTRLAYLFELGGAKTNRVLLFGEQGALAGSNGLPASVPAWFQALTKGSNPHPVFSSLALPFELDGWMTNMIVVGVRFGTRQICWLVYQWDEAASLVETGALSPASETIAGLLTGFLCLLLTLLVYTGQKASTARHELESHFASVAERILGASDDELFEGLARGLKDIFGVHCVLVGEVVEEGGARYAIRSIAIDEPRPIGALWDAGESLAELAASDRPQLVRWKARQRHPDSRFLTEILAESYHAVPLLGQQQQRVGFLALIDTRPMPRSQERFTGMLQILAMRAGAELERLATVRREHSLQEQLRQAQKMDAVGRLAGGIAHDFNNLLQAIQGYTNVVQYRLEEKHPAQRDLLEVTHAVDRAAILIRQLLTFSRQGTGKPVNVQLNEIIQGTMGIITRVLPEDIDITFTPGTALHTILADPSQIEQILVNLCVNARDAMPEGGHLRLQTSNEQLDETFCQTHPWAAPGSFVLLTVSDTGTGMPPDTLERIFEPFFTTKAKDKGSGIGLATVYGIVKQYNGLIAAESVEGAGSTFRVYFPTDENAAPNGSAAPLAAPAKANTSSCGETILFAEDEPAIRELSLKMLKQAGYCVICAADGEEAIDLALRHEGRIDLAILDSIMPKKGGAAVAESLRARWPDIPILFVSGYSGEQLQSPQFHATPIIEKPVRADVLLQRIREILDADKP